MRYIAIALCLVGCKDDKVTVSPYAPSAEEKALEELHRIAKNGPHEDVEATVMARDYAENAVRADALYKKRALRVWGKVTSITTDANGVPFVFVGADVNAPLVGCGDVSRSDAIKLEIGEGAWLKGVGIGLSSGTPMLLFCAIE